MKDEVRKSELLLKTFHRLVSAILGQTGNPENDLLDIMADNINGFGTGKHEVFNDKHEFLQKIFSVFGKQLPAGAQLHFIDIKSQVIDNIGIVHATYEINYVIDGVENNYYGRRSTVFRWDQDGWHAIHLHVSEPSAHLTEGESLPVKALKAQNEELKKQVAVQTEELQRSLDELKATQQQLIQSAKMASLGELTSGIAHEIQNPLNFVNNFSEVNAELVDELKSELAMGNVQSANQLADNIKANQQKINDHGKRADAIVKGMLQHSRTGSGQKEPTDINALADEYLRLAYHGMRAKDKSFNVTTKTEFDNGIGKVSVVQQEIGRVILNLINNAFYTVSEKQKQDLYSYEPTVTISTKKEKDKIEIKVRDNGNGIPQKILDKVFQPFFTTKPTGQGTGLGLSLSYDIVKAHGGELKVETKEGEGSQFIIQLPVMPK